MENLRNKIKKMEEINRKFLCKRRQYTVYSEHNIYYYKNKSVGIKKKENYLFTLVPQKHYIKIHLEK